MAYINLTKANIDTDGTADLFIDTDLTESGIYRWIDKNFIDRPYFTGWDITDTGFMINFDLSLNCNIDCFKTEKQYYSYMKSAIKEQVPAKYMVDKVKETA